MTYQNKFTYYLMKLTEVTQEEVTLSQSKGIATSRISKSNLYGERFIVLKFKIDRIPLSLELNHVDDKISHADLLIELGGSKWLL